MASSNRRLRIRRSAELCKQFCCDDSNNADVAPRPVFLPARLPYCLFSWEIATVCTLQLQKLTVMSEKNRICRHLDIFIFPNYFYLYLQCGNMLETLAIGPKSLD